MNNEGKEEYDLLELMKAAEEALAEDIQKKGLRISNQSPFHHSPQTLWELRRDCIREAKDYFYDHFFDKDGNRMHPAATAPDLFEKAHALYVFYLTGKW